MSRGVPVAVALSAVLLLTAGSARAQAWLPPKGGGSVSLVFQNAFVRDHLFGAQREDVGHITSDSLLMDLTYGIHDRLAVSVGLPYIASKYNGMHPHQLPIDDGSYHETFQDFHFALRYNVARKLLLITPFVSAGIPSHHYEYFAHSAAGQRLPELQLGTYIGRVLDPFLPGVYVSGSYAFGLRQKVLDVSINRSLADVEVGYFVVPAFRAFAVAAGQLTHGGVELPFDEPKAGLTPEEWRHHDQIARTDMLNIGGGAAVSLTDSLELSGSIVTTVAGRNGHALHHAVAVGMTWTFQRRRSTTSGSLQETRASACASRMPAF